MPFSLKNAGATYQRMVEKVFKHQLGRIMKGYVDDVLVKSMTFEQHLLDLRKVFQVLKDHNMKLNPSKCVFAIRGGKFLVFLVSYRGIEPNLEKIQYNEGSATSHREVKSSKGNKVCQFL
jgi:hypothetical protein